MVDIAIVGAGLMGRLLALSLHRQGYHVTLIDQDDKAGKNSAAYAAAGLLTPLGEALHCQTNIVEMGFWSLKKWPEILANLSAYTFFQQTGSIAVSHPQDQGDYDKLQRFLARNYRQHPQHQLTREQLLALEPEIGRRFNHGLFLPEEGQIGNRKLLQALKVELEIAKITWRDNCHVSAIEPTCSGCVLTITDLKMSNLAANKPQRVHFDLVIDCRGIGAQRQRAGTISPDDKTNKQRNATLTDLRAVRGELFQLFAPDVAISRPIRLLHPRYQLYIAPKGKGHYVVGATEIDSDDTSPMTVRSAMELLSAAYSIHPGFAEANIRQHISQLRPAFSDNQPKIISQGALIQVNGLYRHGFLIAPAVLAQVLCHVQTLISNGPTTSTSLSTSTSASLDRWLPITTPSFNQQAAQMSS